VNSRSDLEWVNLQNFLWEQSLKCLWAEDWLGGDSDLIRVSSLDYFKSGLTVVSLPERCTPSFLEKVSCLSGAGEKGIESKARGKLFSFGIACSMS